MVTRAAAKKPTCDMIESAGVTTGYSRGRAPGGGGRTGPFRAHARRAVRLQALATHVHAGWQRQASVEDIGLGGARVVLDEAVAPGDWLTLSFTAPTLWDPLVLRARVAWVTPASGASGSSPASGASGSAAAPPWRAGLAFDHKMADAVFALYELIVTLGYE
jgi:PilZ domain